MEKIKSEIPKVFGFILLVMHVQCGYVKCESNISSYNFKFVNFEQFKTDLFINTFNISSQNHAECFTELKAIKNGIFNSEQWTYQRK